MAVVKRSNFLRMVDKNKRIIRLRSMLETGIYAIDTNRFLRELESLHETRDFRAYELNDVLQNSQRMMIKASLQNSAYRSRAVAIKMRCFRIFKLLEEHLARTTSYIMTKYADMLRMEYTTIKGREQAVKYVLEDFYTLQHKLKTVMDMSDMLIGDLDSTAWSIKATVDMLQMSFQKERNI